MNLFPWLIYVFCAPSHPELQSCTSAYQTLLEITLADMGTSKVLVQFVVSIFHQAELMRHRDIIMSSLSYLYHSINMWQYTEIKGIPWNLHQK